MKTTKKNPRASQKKVVKNLDVNQAKGGKVRGGAFNAYVKAGGDKPVKY